jgi:hypothetical protein
MKKYKHRLGRRTMRDAKRSLSRKIGHGAQTKVWSAFSRATKPRMELKIFKYSCRQQDQFLSSYWEPWPRQHDDIWSNRGMRLGSFSGWCVGSS